MTISTGTLITNLPSGTVLFGNDLFVVTHGITGSATPQTQAVQVAVLQGMFQPSGTAASGGGDLYNYLINGGFDIAQRQVPDTFTAYSSASGSYSADRWKTWGENASYQYARQDGLSETGLTSQYFGAFKKITNTGKMFVYQIVEGVNTAPLRGKTVIFQAQMKASSSKTIRMGIFELQNAGTIDVVPQLLVTAAGANTTDPTMASNVAVITAAQSKSVTTSMQTFSVSVAVPSNSKNLICAVWTDSQFAANDILYIAEAGLYVASSTQVWKPRLYASELLLCKRYCSVMQDIAGTYSQLPLLGVKYATAFIDTNFPHPTEMRVKPTASVVSGTTWSTTTPSGNQVAAYGIVAAGNITITGALTVSVVSVDRTYSYLRFQAGTSFSGSDGALTFTYVGAAVAVTLNAEL